MKNAIITTVLKSLFDKYPKDYLFDSPLVLSLYHKAYKLCLSYPFVCSYISEHFISSPCTCGEFYCTCGCLVIFIKKWAGYYKEYDFLFQDLLDIADAIKTDVYSKD